MSGFQRVGLILMLIVMFVAVLRNQGMFMWMLALAVGIGAAISLVRSWL